MEAWQGAWMDGTMSSVARGTGWGVEKARVLGWELMVGVGLEEEELMMVLGRIEAAGAHVPYVTNRRTHVLV
jgi:hypothetical protein